MRTLRELYEFIQQLDAGTANAKGVIALEVSQELHDRLHNDLDMLGMNCPVKVAVRESENP